MISVLLKTSIALIVTLMLPTAYSLTNAETNSDEGSMQKRIVLIEGIGGGLGTNLLTPEILKLDLKNKPQVVFYGTDFLDKLTVRGKQAVKSLTNNGMIFIDKSDPQALKRYEELQPDYVYIAPPPHTHIALTKEWLNHPKPPNVIMVEKPFTENLQEMKGFVATLNQKSALKTKVYAIDHANAFNLYGENLKQIRDYLGTISDISFFWIQNHTGAHKTNYLLEGDDRPITRENRLGMLPEEKRMVFDTLIHFLVPASEIINPVNANITDIKAAQYENAEIKGETFVATRLLIQDKLNPKNTIAVMLYAGKGIGGVDSLGIKNMAHLLIIRNKLGKEVRLSLDDNTASFINKEGGVEKRLPLPKIYANEMNNLFLGAQDIRQSPEYTLECIKVLDQIRSHIDQYQQHAKLAIYRLGTSKITAPSLEEILQNQRVYGEGKDLLRGQELLNSVYKGL